MAPESSLRRAAERLRVAQPAVSRQIRDLEDELGVQLFERGKATMLQEFRLQAAPQE